tara:strand:+ start:13407 stop:14300 length:894 start_codon:yes stop_codon:yes gene_type:complete
MKKMHFVVSIFFFFSFSAFADESLLDIQQTLKKIERDITDMQKIIFKEKNNLSFSTSNQQSNNSSNEITIFDMRLRDIENELQSINLNYENISFEIEDLKNDLNTINTAIEDVILSINTKLNNKNTSSANVSTDDLQENDLGTEEENSLGSLKINSEDLSEQNNPEQKTIYTSPEEQFQIAFDNLRNQNFEMAKSELELFIKDNKSHKLSGSAHYWLGEIYLLQKEYREAALVFAEGYQKYPDSIKSPESLFKLAETLTKIEKTEDACNTLKQFKLKYPNHKLIDKTELNIQNLECS